MSSTSTRSQSFISRSAFSREFIDLLTREIEEEMYVRENGAVEGSGALGFGLIKDVLKIGKHIIQYVTISSM